MARRTTRPARLVAALGVLLGSVVATVTPAMAAAPGNDMFGAARVLTEPAFFNESELTEGATAEPGEPDHGGRPAAATIWYSWTAPADVEVTSWSSLTLFDSSRLPAHALAFYTGTSLATLVEVVSAAGTDPGVTFEATAGTEYKIALNVRHRHAAEGNTHLYLYASPLNDNLHHATTVGGRSGSRSGYIATATLEESEAQHSLFESYGGSVWFDWTAPTTGFTRFGVECCAGNQPVVAVYTGPRVSDLHPVSSSFSCSVGAFNTCTTFHHTQGTTYHIAVQGDGTSFPLRWAAVASDCTVNGTPGDDVLVGTARTDFVCALGGDDVIEAMDGDDVVVGGAGTDTVSYASATFGVTADLSRAAAFGPGADTLQQVENITGSSFEDTLDGNADGNELRGGEGHDVLRGHEGDDRLFAGSGDDAVATGRGRDVARGGEGSDLLHFGAATTGVSVDLRSGTATGEGADRLSGFEDVLGSEHSDHLAGDGGRNLLLGGSARDVLEGRAGGDRLFGQFGRDSLNGGGGTDVCRGGRGRDAMTRCEST